MIKRSAIAFIVLLLLLPAVLAVEFEVKEEFSQGETFIAKLSGNFVDSVQKENIFFYRGHVRIGMNPFVALINDEYHIYAQLLDKEQNNYSVSIEGVRYMKGSQIIEDNIVRNFSIINNINTTADFTINPGFIITNEDFYIQVQNLQDSKITIDIGADIESIISVELKSGEIEKIDFKLTEITEQTIETITLSSGSTTYEIPIYILMNESQKTNTPKHSGTEEDYEFDLSEINVAMSIDSEKTRVINLKNTGDVALKDITLEVSEQLKSFVELSAYEIDELEVDSEIKIEVYFSSDSQEEILQGQIKAKRSEESYISSAIYLEIMQDYVPPIIDNSSQAQENCEEQKGEFCSDDEKCKGTLEGLCCFGTCEEKGVGSTGKIVGWIIIIAIVLFLLWFFKTKYSKASKKPNLLSIARGKK